MKRDEYLIRAREMAPRGNTLPHAKLTKEMVREARELHERAKFARDHINKNYSIAALAKRYGVSASSLDKALRYESWGHV